ncbi:MAG: cytidylate kinase-like family protein [Bacillota bacterium]|nr:cytidylate kinase-like family protein [Bacillota bacterium]
MNTVITVSREFCSGGAVIAKKVANHFKIPYYDREMIDKTAEILRLSQKEVQKRDEHPVSFWDISGFPYEEIAYAADPSLMLPVGTQIAEAQFGMIKKYAREGACVIVGRCADYVLKDYKNVVNVFIHADMDYRIKRAVRLYDVSEQKARSMIKHIDKIRASYYENYTQGVWGDKSHYQLVINSGEAGIDLAADKIIEYVEKIGK